MKKSVIRGNRRNVNKHVKANSHFKSANFNSRLSDSKRSQSQIISTVLLILLVLAAIVIVSTVVLNVVKKSSKEVSTNIFKNEIEVREVTQAGNTLNIKVRRARGTDVITELKVVVYEKDGGVKTLSQPLITNIEELDTKEITVTAPVGLNTIEKVSVIPIFNGKAGIESIFNNVVSVVEDVIIVSTSYKMQGHIDVGVSGGSGLGAKKIDQVKFNLFEPGSVPGSSVFYKTITKDVGTASSSSIGSGESALAVRIYESEIYPSLGSVQGISKITAVPIFTDTTTGTETSQKDVDKTTGADSATTHGVVRVGNLVPNPLFTSGHPPSTTNGDDEWASSNSPIQVNVYPGITPSPILDKEGVQVYAHDSAYSLSDNYVISGDGSPLTIGINPSKSYKISVWLIGTGSSRTSNIGINLYSDVGATSQVFTRGAIGGATWFYGVKGVSRTGSPTPLTLTKWEGYLLRSDYNSPYADCDDPSTTIREYCNVATGRYLRLYLFTLGGSGTTGSHTYFFYPRIEEVVI